MSGIQFAQPEWATALWAVAAVAGVLMVLELRGGRNLNRFIKTDMQGRLVHRLTRARRFSSLALLIVALVAIVIALMRPQWGIEFIRTPQVGAEIMIALDVSRSMLAEDVAPNRLERAKAEIRDLLPYLKGDQVGLIAFAGRASVLSPLTPDFGFLRLVLDHVRAGSASRGGTRLEEPIRKATEGFGSTGDLARVLLFFTDGEDHDSFPLDAAQEAAERGIRIVIIGFGDETGSEIWVTDPLSGARTRILDTDGRPAISRLDGTLLRELALVTEGAYVPAGTGVLDLKSIFDAHLRPLMRGEGESAGQTVQKEGFGWALLVALLALVGHGLLTQQRQRPLSALVLILLILPGVDARAQSDPTSPPPALEILEESDEFPEQSTTAALDVPEDPRQAYNQGVDAFDQGELNDAERLFEAARQQARGDGTLRFQATYNQSWVEVERAEEKLQEDPTSALENLERAADWLREAIALRPKNKSARINLEILLQRMLLLSDALAAETPPDIARRLDTLIESQRAVTREIRGVAGQFEESPDLDPDEATRARFRGVAVAERTVLTDTGQLAKTVGDELSSLQQKPEDERTPEEAMQMASLEGVLHYLHRSRERIGQSRVQLRRRQAGRAHRRAVAGLFELKRAREQLLGPVELIEGLIQDNHELTEETALLLSGTVEFASPSDTPSFASPPIPAWLDLDYLEEAARSLTERTSELNAKLSAGLGQSQESTDPAQQKAMETLRVAQPHIEVAATKLADSADALASAEPERALKDEFASLQALVHAREQFLDLRGLIEIAWSDESRIRAVLENEESGSLVELAQALAELQKKNLERAERMGLLIEEERNALSSSSSGLEPATEEDRAAEEERLELANGILALIESAMRGAHASLNSLGQEPTALAQANERVTQSIRGLEGLRRLFFSIIEHLKDVAQLQVQLGDETEEVAGRTATVELLGPLEKHQQELAERSEELAQVLHEQSFAQPAELVGQEASLDPAAAKEAAERLTQASELVLMASQDMLAAADGLEADSPAADPSGPGAEPSPPNLEGVRGQQDAALDKLGEALAILQPPQPESEPENQEQPDQQEQDSQSEGDQAQENQPPKETETPQDPNQLLQSVRDREAERHRRKQEEDSSGYNPVEKDW